MIDIQINNGGIVSINSVLMGTPKKQVIEELKAAGYCIKDDGGSLIAGLSANGIPPNSLDALHLNINDLGDVCDGFVFHTHLSYNKAYELQHQYVKLVDGLRINKVLRGTVVTHSIVYSYTNDFFKVEIARWREGGESADISTNENDYAVSVFITSLVEEIKTVAEMKKYIYRNMGMQEHNHKTLWLSLALIAIVVSIMLIVMVWPKRNSSHYVDGLYSIEASEDNSPKTDGVYVCTSENAKKYHRLPNCRWLENCSSEIREITITMAENQGKTPCKSCYQ